MQNKQNLQDLFLLRAKRDRVPVTMFLMNGFQMRGTITGFDPFVVILDSEGRAWCLEINSLPGMTPGSLLPKEAAAVGISYPELCRQILELSLQ